MKIWRKDAARGDAWNSLPTYNPDQSAQKEWVPGFDAFVHSLCSLTQTQEMLETHCWPAIISVHLLIRHPNPVCLPSSALRLCLRSCLSVLCFFPRATLGAWIVLLFRLAHQQSPGCELPASVVTLPWLSILRTRARNKKQSRDDINMRRNAIYNKQNRTGWERKCMEDDETQENDWCRNDFLAVPFLVSYSLGTP